MAMLATVRIGAIHSVVFGGKSYYSVLEFEIHAEQKTEIMFSKCCDTVSLQVQTTDRMKIWGRQLSIYTYSRPGYTK